MTPIPVHPVFGPMPVSPCPCNARRGVAAVGRNQAASSPSPRRTQSDARQVNRLGFRHVQDIAGTLAERTKSTAPRIH